MPTDGDKAASVSVWRDKQPIRGMKHVMQAARQPVWNHLKPGPHNHAATWHRLQSSQWDTASQHSQVTEAAEWNAAINNQIHPLRVTMSRAQGTEVPRNGTRPWLMSFVTTCSLIKRKACCRDRRANQQRDESQLSRFNNRAVNLCVAHRPCCNYYDINIMGE